MGRKTESLQHALITKVLPKIRNNKTSTVYKKRIKNFARWAKGQGYKRPEDINVDVIQEYERYLEDSPKQYSPATIHAYISPVCSAANVSMDEIRKPKRLAGSITRGRDVDIDGQPIIKNIQGRRQETNQKYARLVTLQRATGIRRSELAKLTGADIEERGESLYVIVRRGKGGKQQDQYILPKDTEAVRSVFADVAPGEKVFSSAEMSCKINLHGLRAKHAQECYEHYARIISGNPVYADRLRKKLLERWERGHERLHSQDPKAWERQRTRFIADMDDRPYLLRGDNYYKAVQAGRPTEYCRLALMCVSVWHLSHWRLDVTTTNYLLA